MARQLVFLAMLVYAAPLARASAQPSEPAEAGQPAAQESVADPSAESKDAQLAELREGVTEAYNAGDLDKLLSFCHQDVIATWQNGFVAQGHEGVREVVKQLTAGEQRVMSGYSAEPTVEYRLPIPDRDVLIAAGDLNDSYTLTRPDGTEVRLDSKWTAAVARIDGRWQIVSFHVSTNAFDNQVISLYMNLARITWGLIGGAGGLVLGLLLGVLFSRRRSRRDSAATQ